MTVIMVVWCSNLYEFVKRSSISEHILYSVCLRLGISTLLFTSCETNPRKPDHTTPSPHGVEKWIARSNLWGIESGYGTNTVATKTLVTVKAVTRL